MVIGSNLFLSIKGCYLPLEVVLMSQLIHPNIISCKKLLYYLKKCQMGYFKLIQVILSDFERF